MKTIAYLRISTTNPDEAMQRKALDSCHIDQWFIEKISCSETMHPILQEMLSSIEPGDLIYTLNFSGLGRSTEDLLSIIDGINKAGGNLITIAEKFDSRTEDGKSQLATISKIADFEKSLVYEKQLDGIEKAKQAGKYKGRKAVTVPNIGDYYQKYITKQSTKTSIAEELNISRTTLDKLFKDYRKETADGN